MSKSVKFLDDKRKMEKNAKIFVAGSKGLVGSAITRLLKQQGYTNLILPDRSSLDLINQQAVQQFFMAERPEYVFLAAARVGGIYANNTYRGEFIYSNLIIQTNVIESARIAQVKRLMFLGSSCIYPRHCSQPMKEEYLLSGPLERTNEPYAIAKIAGIKMCEAYNTQYGTDFISVMPTNLYGPNDNFDLENAHVLPALLRKFHEAKISNAKQVVVWGSGAPKREFMYVDDLASACIFLMNRMRDRNIINIGTNEEVSIAELAETICSLVGFKGKIVFDSSKPDGMMRKLLDNSQLNQLGWQPNTTLQVGLKKTYEWLLKIEQSTFKNMVETIVPATLIRL